MRFARLIAIAIATLLFLLLAGLDSVLPDPKPGAWIKTVGDSNIVLFLCAWIDQREASFLKARSAAIAAVKGALEDSGFALPEPLYRLRFDGPMGDQLVSAADQRIYSVGDLMRAAASASGGQMALVIRRGGALIESTVTAGPLGVNTSRTRVDSDPS